MPEINPIGDDTNRFYGVVDVPDGGYVGKKTAAPRIDFDHTNSRIALNSGARIEEDGTIVFIDDATVWDDYVTPLGPNNWNGVSNNPTLTNVADDGSGSQGVYANVFSDGDEAIITAQMPHKWKEGTIIYPHIHFKTMTDVSPADNFGIAFEYWWSSINDGFPVNTTLSTIDISTGINSSSLHQFANITAAGIDATGQRISSVLLCRIGRVAAVADNYGAGVAILDFDIHYQIDTVGSRLIGTK